MNNKYTQTGSIADTSWGTPTDKTNDSVFCLINSEPMTSTLLCDICAVQTGIRPVSWNILTNNYTGNKDYQLEKFYDHTITGHRTSSDPVSLLDDPKYETYKGYIVNTLFSGYYEIDYRGRVNKTMYLGNKIGVNFDPKTKQPLHDEHFFKVVKWTEATGVHGYSFEQMSGSPSNFCTKCGKKLY